MGVKGDGGRGLGATSVHVPVTSELLCYDRSSDGEHFAEQLVPLSEDYRNKSRCVSSPSWHFYLSSNASSHRHRQRHDPITDCLSSSAQVALTREDCHTSPTSFISRLITMDCALTKMLNRALTGCLLILRFAFVRIFQFIERQWCIQNSSTDFSSFHLYPQTFSKKLLPCQYVSHLFYFPYKLTL